MIAELFTNNALNLVIIFGSCAALILMSFWFRRGNRPGCCATVGEVFAQYQQKHQRKNAKSNTKFQPGIKMQSVN